MPHFGGGFGHGGWGYGGWGHGGWGHGGWGYGLGMGLVGGAILGSALASPYYGYGYGYGMYYPPPPIVVQQPASQIILTSPPQQVMSQSVNTAEMYPGNAPATNNPTTTSSSSSLIPPSQPHPPHLILPPSPPTYAERKQMFAHGYGMDPDIVFNLWENPSSNSWCGVSGPMCPCGAPATLSCVDGAVPHELTDIYTVDQWITLRQSIEDLHQKYQFHCCPMFFMCCMRFCLESSFNTEMTQIMAAENIRLHDEGVFWDWDASKEKYETKVRESGVRGSEHTLRLLCSLKVQPDQRYNFEQLHPERRRLYTVPYGQIAFLPRGPPPSKKEDHDSETKVVKGGSVLKDVVSEESNSTTKDQMTTSS